MPQDKTINAEGKEINPQELSTKIVAAKREGAIMPFDKTTVYSTGKGGFTPAGEAMEVHPELAKKLIEAGKATAEKQEEKPENTKKDK